jgi:hypothetical protein
MSTDREQNGPTQVHPQINYNELPSHIGLNGINGIGMMGKSFGKQTGPILIGILPLDQSFIAKFNKTLS